MSLDTENDEAPRDAGGWARLRRGESPLYAWPALYALVMRALHGRSYEARYAAVAAEIPPDARVVDVCAGDARLYRRHLRQKRVDYLALDASQAMVRWVRRRGVEARVFDLRRESPPAADVIVLQASLYQFAAEAEAVLTRLRAAAGERLIIAESIRSYGASRVPWFGRVARWLARPPGGTAASDHRFDEASLRALAERVGGLERCFLAPGAREWIAVFRGSTAASS